MVIFLSIKLVCLSAVNADVQRMAKGIESQTRLLFVMHFVQRPFFVFPLFLIALLGTPHK